MEEELRRPCLHSLEATALGGDLGQRYHVALRVCAIGDLHSVDIAQTVHERVLEPKCASTDRQAGVWLSASLD